MIALARLPRWISASVSLGGELPGVFLELGALLLDQQDAPAAHGHRRVERDEHRDLGVRDPGDHLGVGEPALGPGGTVEGHEDARDVAG